MLKNGGNPILNLKDWSQLVDVYKKRDDTREMVIKRCRDMQVQ